MSQKHSSQYVIQFEKLKNSVRNQSFWINEWMNHLKSIQSTGSKASDEVMKTIKFCTCKCEQLYSTKDKTQYNTTTWTCTIVQVPGFSLQQPTFTMLHEYGKFTIKQGFIDVYGSHKCVEVCYYVHSVLPELHRPAPLDWQTPPLAFLLRSSGSLNLHGGNQWPSAPEPPPESLALHSDALLTHNRDYHPHMCEYDQKTLNTVCNHKIMQTLFIFRVEYQLYTGN